MEVGIVGGQGSVRRTLGAIYCDQKVEGCTYQSSYLTASIPPANTVLNAGVAVHDGQGKCCHGESHSAVSHREQGESRALAVNSMREEKILW